MVLKICAVISLIVGALSILISPVAFFTAGAVAGLYFAILGIFCVNVGRWWIK